MSKKISFHVLLLFTSYLGFIISSSSLLSVVVGISCLENKSLSQKIILLHDKHENASDRSEDETKQHQRELSEFIAALVKHSNKSSFFIEFPYKTKNFKSTYNNSTIHVPIKDAIAHDMEHASIEYCSFDERNEGDFWVREMLTNTEGVAQALKNGCQIPEEFNKTSIESYLDSLQIQEKIASEIIKKLPNELQKIVFEKLDFYKSVNSFISYQVKNKNMNNELHFFYLVKALQPDLKAQLFINISYAQSVVSDLSLLHKILNNKNKFLVVCAGAFHTYNLEKHLLVNGFEIYANKDQKNGLNAEYLSNIIWPSKIPSSVKAPIYEFFSLCDICGKETAKKCGSCKTTYFCSRECQKNGWSKHKLNCKK
ncbi:MAG: zinc finger MYND domain-containing protein [Candidatus Babeliales bacterium]